MSATPSTLLYGLVSFLPVSPAAATLATWPEMIFTCYQLILAVLCDDLYALPQPPPRVPQQPGRRAVVTPELVNRLENILKHDKAEEFTWIRDTPSISAAEKLPNTHLWTSVNLVDHHVFTHTCQSYQCFTGQKILFVSTGCPTYHVTLDFVPPLNKRAIKDKIWWYHWISCWILSMIKYKNLFLAKKINQLWPFY